MSNQSLVLRGLTRQRSGHYKCVGVNARGEGSSNLVPLTVRYTPVCRYPSRNIRGAERGDFLNLSCSVDALPLPTKYRWALNTTRGWRDIIAGSPGSSTAMSSSSSSSPLVTLSSSTNEETLRFRPELEADSGTLACWAYSDLGWQHDPCLFRFYPADGPQSHILAVPGFIVNNGRLRSSSIDVNRVPSPSPNREVQTSKTSQPAATCPYIESLGWLELTKAEEKYLDMKTSLDLIIAQQDTRAAEMKADFERRLAEKEADHVNQLATLESNHKIQLSNSHKIHEAALEILEREKIDALEGRALAEKMLLEKEAEIEKNTEKEKEKERQLSELKTEIELAKKLQKSLYYRLDLQTLLAAEEAKERQSRENVSDDSV